MPTLSLCMIVKDVARVITGCLSSVIDQVNEVVIVDTGSSDGTQEVIRSYLAEKSKRGAVLDFNEKTNPEAFLLDVAETWTDKPPGPFSGKHMLADFGAARQFGWEKATGDYILWIDSDDVVEGAKRIPEVLSQMQENRIDTAFVVYDYEHDVDGKVTCFLRRERILRKGVGRWGAPIHETIFPAGTVKFYDEFKIVHRRRELGIVPPVTYRNLKVLLHWYDRKKDSQDADPRMLFYLGNEMKYVWPERALTHFADYCRKSGWDAERSVAHKIAGEIQEGLAAREGGPLNRTKLDLAQAEFSLATLEDENNPDGYLGAARIAYYKNDWGKCIEWTERGFATAEKAAPSMLMHDPSDRQYKPFIYYSRALLELGQAERGLAACEAGLLWNPQDETLIVNKKYAEGLLANRDNAKWQAKLHREAPLHTPSAEIPPAYLTAIAIEMWKKIMESGDRARAQTFLDSLPDKVEEKRIKAAKLFMENQLVVGTNPVSPEPKPNNVSGGPLDIVIWTGSAWESWSPNNLEKGLGGSELAAIYMAKELQQLGHKVRVLCECSGQEGMYDGVEFTHYGKGPRTCDVLIASRRARVLKDFEAKAKFVWVHDTHLGESTADLQECISEADGFLCLSNWHKRNLRKIYPFIPESAITVTRNGIDPRRFAREPVKTGNRLIYASSPDRGLTRLLELFPRVRADVPDAELHVYYGFVTWEAMARSSGDQEALQKVEEFKKKIAETAGVVLHGRVGQQELAEAYSASKVWAYPTWFTETSCISAMEAQAAGCVPVTTALAALQETVQHGVLIPAPDHTPEYADAWVKETIDLLQNEDRRKKLAFEGRIHALSNLGWPAVATQWINTFREAIKTATKIKVGERPLRVAVLLGKAGASIHGILDAEHAFDGNFATGTVSGFFNIAWGLAELGNIVDAFGDLAKPAIGLEALGGANFYPLDEHTPDNTYDAYISINEPDVLRPFPKDKLRICVQWQNSFDYCQPGFDSAVDIYACPSETLRQRLGALGLVDPKKLIVVPLSSNLEFFQPQANRKPGSIAYCSSPDRGLHHILEFFPEIRAQVPEANLRIYYRLQPWLDHIFGDPHLAGTEFYRRAKLIQEALEKLGTNGENGVTVVGPIPPRRLAKELCETKVMAYTFDPMRFTEGFSTAVLDACASGCIPIISAADALPEVYKDSAVFIPENPGVHRAEWISTVVGALRGETPPEMQAKFLKRAQDLSRPVISRLWEKTIRENLR